jgi:BirA family biotin operon repressor/biotin-[acetyl-CoA-carboxylase] ligase
MNAATMQPVIMSQVKDKIIELLRQGQQPVSGQAMSRRLRLSRAAVWKHIQELRKEGYRIEAAPHVGYVLKKAPDRLLPLEVRNGLTARRFGQTLTCLDVVDTTMDVAFQQAVDGAPEGALVCAESQKKGKGRMGRQWVSPKGKGLYFSLVLRPALHPSQVSQLTLLSSVAVCAALRAVSDVPVTIKWPNDLLVGPKKMGGILTELSAETERVRFVVVGVGINVNTNLKSLPANSTSLAAEAHQTFQRVAVLQSVLEKMEFWYDRALDKGFDCMRAQWKAYSCTLGRQVQFMDRHQKRTGIAVDLHESGALKIKDAKGRFHNKMSGDVRY